MMTAPQETLAIFASIGATLVLASVVGFLLKRRRAPDQPHGAIDNLNARIRAWWVMVLVIGLAFVFGRAGVIVLFLFVSFFALREFMSLTYTRRGDHDALATSFFIVLPLQYWFVWSGWYGLYSIFIPVYAFLVLPILSALSGDTMRFLERGPRSSGG